LEFLREEGGLGEGSRGEEFWECFRFSLENCPYFSGWIAWRRRKNLNVG
jgi:hypothetical protein